MPDISVHLQDQIATARHERIPLQIVGGDSKAFLGRHSEGDPLLVAEHSGIVDYQPLELVMTVRAGTPLSEVEAALAEKGQMLPFEPPYFSEKSTVGGTLACNLSGPSRPWSGSVRDHVLGVRLINGKAESLKFGGQVMKNVAGYDASRLQAGAMGTLGVLTEISFKVLPMHAMSKTLIEEIPEEHAIELMNVRAGKAAPITAACWLDGRLYTRLSGAATVVDATIGLWPGEVMDNDQVFWSRLRDQQHEWFSDPRPLWRFSVKPTAAPISTGDWLIDWGGAQRWLKADGSFSDMMALAETAGGQVSLFRGGDRDLEVFHSPSDVLKRIQKNIKASFDPEAILNPRRLYSWM